jgi:hypothetical protein
MIRIFATAAIVLGALCVTPVLADDLNPATGPGSAAAQSGGYHGGPSYGTGLNTGADHLKPGPRVAPVPGAGTTGSGMSRGIAPNRDCATTDSYGRTSVTKC